jgi:hypothetical protein
MDEVWPIGAFASLPRPSYGLAPTPAAVGATATCREGLGPARTGFPRSPCRSPIAQPGARPSRRASRPAPAPPRYRPPRSTAARRNRQARARAHGRRPSGRRSVFATLRPLPLGEPPAQRRGARSRSVSRARDRRQGNSTSDSGDGATQNTIRRVSRRSGPLRLSDRTPTSAASCGIGRSVALATANARASRRSSAIEA